MSAFEKLPLPDVDETLPVCRVFVSKPGAGHVGLIYLARPRDGDKNIVPGPRSMKALHLSVKEVHEDSLVLKTSARRYLVASIDLSTDESIHLTAFLDRAMEKLPAIQYGVDWLGAKGSFKTGFYTAPEGSIGLTCASFVSELLAGCGHRPILDSDWPTNAQDDRDWLNDLINDYRKRIATKETTMTEERLVEMAAIDPLARIHPAEIAAAAAEAPSKWSLKHVPTVACAKALAIAYDATPFK